MLTLACRGNGSEPGIAIDSGEIQDAFEGGSLDIPPDGDAESSRPDLDRQEDGPGDEDDIRDTGPAWLDITILPQELELLEANALEDIRVEVEVDYLGRTYEGVILQLHGGFARTAEKKSYRLTFPDADEVSTDVFGDAPPQEYRRLVLNASWIDPTFMRNLLTMEVHRRLDGLAPRMGFAEVAFNGSYHGLYVVTERIDRQFLQRQGLDRLCNLYKAVNHWANWADKEDPLAGYEVKINDSASTDDLTALLHTLSNTPTTEIAYQQEVEPILSLDDFMSWQIAHTLAMDQDCYTKNYYLYHDVDSVPGEPEYAFRVISWDADATWGISWEGSIMEPTQRRWMGSDAFSPRLLGIPGYRRTYLERYRDALAGALAAQELSRRIDEVALLIGEAARRDLLHWNRGFSFDDEVTRLQEAVAERHRIMTEVVMQEIDR